VHIALAGKDVDGNHNTMAVSWQTTRDTTGSEVHYGTTPGVYDAQATGYSGACMYLRELIYDYIHPFTLSNFRL
jgi:hypothetical protein